MPSKLIISISGVRGIVGDSLTEETATRFAAALGTHTGGGKIVMSRDGRPTGEMLCHAALAGLMATGCTVYDIGIAPTPTCGLAVRQLNADGALQITASHNPIEWNGLKIFGSDGRVVNAKQGKRIQAIYEDNRMQRVGWERIGIRHATDEATTWHIDRVLPLLDTERVRSQGFRVLLDANGGAGGPLGKRLLEKLQCQVVAVGCDADGVFAHPPEPIAAHLQDVLPLVTENKANVGFVLDPDADRLAIIDETGRYIGEELTLALAVKMRLQQQPGPVVINMSTSRIVQDIAAELGVPCHRSAVGEANVADEMQRVHAVIGGEGNGGVIDPRVGFVRDPFIGMGMVLDLMATTNRPLSKLVDELPEYHIVKEKVEVDRDRLATQLETLERQYSDATANRTDGLRMDWEKSWVHVRPSNTEPVVRVIAEAPDRATAEQLCQEVGAIVNDPP